VFEVPAIAFSERLHPRMKRLDRRYTKRMTSLPRVQFILYFYPIYANNIAVQRTRNEDRATDRKRTGQVS
jgi:hypothetical protein